MSSAVLFSLEQCEKCMQVKELLAQRKDIKIVTFPHDFSQWNPQDLELAQSYDVFEDLQQTAPILWVDGKKLVGFLRIKKWVQDQEKKNEQ